MLYFALVFQADVIDAFNTSSRYLDDILNINNVYFDNMVSQIYPSEPQLNKANTSDTKAAFLDLHLSISNDIQIIQFFLLLSLYLCFMSLLYLFLYVLEGDTLIS